MKRRVLSVMLVVLLVLSCAPTALAADDTTPTNTVLLPLGDQRESEQEETIPKLVQDEPIESTEPSPEATPEPAPTISPEPVNEAAKAENAAVMMDAEPESVYEFSMISGGTSVKITGYTGVGGDLIIPNTLGGKPVTEIGDFAFYSKSNITGVSIPDGVSVIGQSAFWACTNLVWASLPDGLLNIDLQAFAGCKKLSNLDLPPNLRSIGVNAFGGDASLTEIVIPASVTSIGMAPFQGCEKLTAINVETGNTYYKSEDGVLFDFAMTKLIQFPPNSNTTAYVIPNGVECIEYTAFYRCKNLKSLYCPTA